MKAIIRCKYITSSGGVENAKHLKYFTVILQLNCENILW